jgi:hypothetical protein
MKRPKPLPAVDRNNTTKSAAAPAGANVRPSDIWSTLGDIAKVAGPIAMALL